MEVRPAQPSDCPAIRDVVIGSLETSYSLSPQEIQSLLESEFSPETLGERIDAADVRPFVAVGSESVSGFVEVDVDGDTTLRWLHVHPTARGRGVGTALVERVKEAVATEASNEPAVPVLETIDAEAEERYLGDEDPVTGTEAPFFHAFSDLEHEEPYGHFCFRCGNTDATADGLDRLQCADCGNHHDADEWDASFL